MSKTKGKTRIANAHRIRGVTRGSNLIVLGSRFSTFGDKWAVGYFLKIIFSTHLQKILYITDKNDGLVIAEVLGSVIVRRPLTSPSQELLNQS